MFVFQLSTESNLLSDLKLFVFYFIIHFFLNRKKPKYLAFSKVEFVLFT